MGKKTFWDTLYENTILRIEYYFAKRWLDGVLGSKYGKQEYWGDFLYEKLIEEHHDAE